ncbi:hypothetical protein CS062_01460 [Roseateles chitinivorans]|uniref:DUF1178 family protein n=1 Tax=Roseateles chitinivorans TaxID=2917965 RepID=A0A2G9CES0_9BURK|nr:DUF1178 family protein [Roseateles chitinivorans]PIM54897.1 hypothetical protein CS062_01460 [Roseateles chitinivorans]
MLVLNLACDTGHSFEGWFASATDFESQQQRGLLSCPLCNSANVRRMPSAPRLNLSAAAEPAPSQPRAPTSPVPVPAASALPPGAPVIAVELQKQVIQAVRTLMANTEDVGDRFATEARRIHYGEAQERGIRGRATPDEARELADEGIDIVALPVPDALKDPLQ